MHIEVEQMSTLYSSNLSQNGNKLIEERICTAKNKLHSHEQFPSWKGLATSLDGKQNITPVSSPCRKCTYIGTPFTLELY